MLDELISEGEKLLNGIEKNDVSSEDYEKWCSACIRFLEVNYKGSVLIEKFITITEVNDSSGCKNALAVLEGIKKVDDYDKNKIAKNAKLVESLNRPKEKNFRKSF